MARIVTAVIGTAALVGLLAPLPAAQADPTTLVVNKCSSAKIKLAGKDGAASTGCYSKRAAKGLPRLDINCISKASEKLYDGFGKLDASGSCLTTGDGLSINSDVQEVVDAINTAVGNAGPPSRCDAGKLKCVGKYIAGVAGCYAKAAGKTAAVDGGCISKNEDKFSGGAKTCYEKAVARADCSSTSPADVVRTLADTFLVATVCKLNPDASPDCPSSSMCGNSMLDPGEQCDGTDAAACPGICEPTCTCPQPVCGNGIVEGTEQCDGSNVNTCALLEPCRSDCTCRQPGQCSIEGTGEACSAGVVGTPCGNCVVNSTALASCLACVANPGPATFTACAQAVNDAGCGPVCCP